MTALPAASEAAASRDAKRPATALRVAWTANAPALARFAFADGNGDALHIHCARLVGPEAPEAWIGGDGYRVVAFDIAESGADIEQAARAAYTGLIARVRGSSHPYLLRIWNYFGAINAGDGDGERYRRFCVGRAGSVDAAFNDPPPAATAIGHDAGPGSLQVIALCGHAPGIALENPRQTPAWSYPRDYGPVSPGFSRGALLEAASASPLLLASGTASIVGHVSQHVGDVAEQLRESLRNLEALLAVGRERSGHAFGFEGCQALRVYLRYPADLAVAREIIAGTPLPAETALFLRGDVCRRELDVELEGVFAAG